MSPKRVIFLKILIYDFFGFFGNLFLFLRILIPLKIGKKGVYFSQEPRADVARRGTRANGTWHARPVVVPRGPTLPLASHGGGTDPSPRGHMSSLGDVPGAHAFLNSVWGGAGAVRGSPTEFRANRWSFGGLIGGFEKSCLRRFGGYRQNSHLKWPSMWCSDWAEILCGNVSRREEHAQKVLRDLHERHRRCFRTRDVSWASPWMFVGHLARSGTVGGTPLGHERDALVCF